MCATYIGHHVDNILADKIFHINYGQILIKVLKTKTAEFPD